MKDLEKELERREEMALKLADMLNEKIFEFEREKKIVEIMSKRIHDYEVENETLKEELAHFKYLYKVVSLHEEEA